MMQTSPFSRRVCLQTLAAAPLAAALAAAHAAPPTARVRRAPVGAGVYELACSARLGLLCAAVSGGFAASAPAGHIALLDPASLRPLGRIALRHPAFGLALDDAAGLLYVGHSLDGRIGAVDLRTRRPLGELQLSEPLRNPAPGSRRRHRHDLRALLHDPARERLYVPGLAEGGSVLFVVDTRRWTLLGTLPGLGFYPTGLALDARGQRLFVSTMGGDILVVDTQALDGVRRLPAPRIEQPVSLLHDAGQDRLYVVDQGDAAIRAWQRKRIAGFQSREPGQRIVTLDAATGALAGSWPTGAAPLAIARAPGGDLLTTERLAGTVTRYAPADGRATQRWTPGLRPNSLALDAGGRTLFVSLKHDPRAKSGEADWIARIALC